MKYYPDTINDEEYKKSGAIAMSNGNGRDGFICIFPKDSKNALKYFYLIIGAEPTSFYVWIKANNWHHCAQFEAALTIAKILIEDK